MLIIIWWLAASTHLARQIRFLHPSGNRGPPTWWAKWTHLSWVFGKRSRTLAATTSCLLNAAPVHHYSIFDGLLVMCERSWAVGFQVFFFSEFYQRSMGMVDTKTRPVCVKTSAFATPWSLSLFFVAWADKIFKNVATCYVSFWEELIYSSDSYSNIAKVIPSNNGIFKNHTVGMVWRSIVVLLLTIF